MKLSNTTRNSTTTQRNAHLILRVIAATLAAICLAAPHSANAQKAVVGIQNPGEALSMNQIDHRPWDALLQKYVDGNGNVNYGAWKASGTDTQGLDVYLNHLSSASPAIDASREAKLAFWINAYNAVTVRGILREYPTTSIKNHVSKLGGYNIWSDFKLFVGGQPYSLNNMEHKLLRKMHEPRIHFAIVCASRSCPRLMNRAFFAESLESQLQENTRYFFAQPGNFHYDAAKNRMALSAILKWYGTDFAPTAQEQLKMLATYLPDAESQRAAAAGGFRVTYQKYDWGLNDQSRGVPKSARR